MPGRSHKAGDKKAANVDRYGVNPPRDSGEVEEMEAGAEDASYATHTEDEGHVEPLLNGSDETHESPPKEWTLADGSPVFRAGKKSLRKQPRLNRRDHGEDSDAIIRRERRARGEIVTPTESSSEASTPTKTDASNRSNSTALVVVPVPKSLRPAGVTSPAQSRNTARRQAQTPSTPTRTTQTTKTSPAKEFQTAIDPRVIGGLFLLAFLLGSLLVYFLIPHPVTVHSFEGPADSIKTIDEIINNHSPLQSILSDLNKNDAARISQISNLQTRIAGLSKQIDDVNEQVKRNTQELQKLVSSQNAQDEARKSLEKELEQNVADLKKQMNTQKAELSKLMNDLDSKSLDKAIERLENIREDLRKELESTKNSLRKEIEAAMGEAKNDAKNNAEKAITAAKDEMNQELYNQIVDLKRQIQTQTPADIPTQVIPSTVDEKELASLKARLDAVESALKDVKSIKTHAEQVVKDVMAQQDTKNKIAALVKEEVERLTPSSTQPSTTPVPTAIDEKKVEALVNDLLSKDERYAKLNENIKKTEEAAKKAEESAKAATNSANSASSHANNAASSANTAASSASTASTSATSASTHAAASAESAASASKSATEALSSVTSAASAASNAQRIADEIRRSLSTAVHGQVSSGVGKPDHALYKIGARVLASKTGWDPRYSWGKNGGLLSWFFSNDQPTRVSPNVALDPSLTPGDCWAFPAKQANFSVKIPCPIVPSAFTIDHIPVSEALNKGTMPHTFSVYGLLSSTPNGHDYSIAVPLLTDAVYHAEGPTAQVFNVPEEVINHAQPFSAFTLAITDNYGAEFTCLYRFRVHGERIGKCETEAAVSVAPPA